MLRLAFRIAIISLAGLAACTTTGRPDDPAYSQTGGGKADGSWCHLDFTSSEGTSIHVDYVLQESSSGSEERMVANPTWVNVQRADLDSSQAVHVWIGDEAYINKEGYAAAQEYGGLDIGPDVQLDLYRSEDATRFTGPVNGSLPVYDYYEGDDEATIHAHQFAVVIDGAWQTDPISGTHNFLSTDLYGCGN